MGSTGHVWDEDLVELNAPLPRWWLHLFNLTIIFAFIYMVLFPGLGNVPGVLKWSQVGRYEAEMEKATAAQESVYARFREMETEELIADTEANGIGRRLFGNNCAMCHGSDGRGATGFPNLTDSDWLYGNTPEQVMTSISQGRVGSMPPLGAAIGEQGVQDVTAYVQSLSSQDTDMAAAAAGKQHFDTVCMACHGLDGKGNQMLGAPDLTNGIWLYGGGAEAIAEGINNGRSGNMPAHQNLLSEDRRRILTAYVLSLSDQASN